MCEAQEYRQLINFSSNKQQCYYELYRNAQNKQILDKRMKRIEIKRLKEIKDNFYKQFSFNKQVVDLNKTSLSQCSKYICSFDLCRIWVTYWEGRNNFVYKSMTLSCIGIAGSFYCIWKLVVPFFVKTFTSVNKIEVNKLPQPQQNGFLNSLWKIIRFIGIGTLGMISGTVICLSTVLFLFCCAVYSSNSKEIGKINQRHNLEVSNLFKNNKE